VKRGDATETDLLVRWLRPPAESSCSSTPVLFGHPVPLPFSCMPARARALLSPELIELPDLPARGHGREQEQRRVQSLSHGVRDGYLLAGLRGVWVHALDPADTS
jgi:hypothetical protein